MTEINWYASSVSYDMHKDFDRNTYNIKLFVLVGLPNL